MANLSSSLENLMKQIGKECIYKEGGLILHAELLAINIKSDMLELTFKKIPSQGFTERDIRTFTFRCIRAYLHFEPNRLCSSLINLEIFLQRAEVQSIVNFMSETPNSKATIQKLRKYRKI